MYHEAAETLLSCLIMARCMAQDVIVLIHCLQARNTAGAVQQKVMPRADAAPRDTEEAAGWFNRTRSAAS